MSEKASILISGASRGLGLAIAKTAVEGGHCVTGFARNASDGVEQLRRSHPDSFHFVTGDMTDPEGFKPIVQEAERKFGQLTGLVNNAGSVSEQLLARHKIDEIDRLLSINLRGTLLLTQQAVRSMMIAGRGSVVNISSIVSVSGYKGTVAYSATKGGIDAATRAMARELGGRGINVNSVAPGYMETDLVAEMSERHLKQIVRRTPLGRAGDVDDVSGVVLFLLSPAARFISGQTIVVDGGLTA